MTPWKVLASRVLLDRRWLRVREERVLLPNGTVIDEFHLLDSPSWAAVLAITDAGEIVLVEQYRHGVARLSRELPAGVIDAGETPLQAAQRELLEETGYEATRWLPLLEVSPETSRHTHRAHFFVALGAHPVAAARPESCEVLQVCLAPAAGIVEAALRGEIEHGLHVAALLAAERKGLLVPGASTVR